MTIMEKLKLMEEIDKSNNHYIAAWRRYYRVHKRQDVLCAVLMVVGMALAILAMFAE